MAYNRKAYNRSAYNALAGVITLISFSYAGTSTQPTIAVKETSFPAFTQNGSQGTSVSLVQTDFIFGTCNNTSSQGVSCTNKSFPTLAYAGTSTQPSIDVKTVHIKTAETVTAALMPATTVTALLTKDTITLGLMPKLTLPAAEAQMPTGSSLTVALVSDKITIDLRQAEVLTLGLE